jgi:ATP-dependent Clp protease adaptor protein ClpS
LADEASETKTWAFVRLFYWMRQAITAISSGTVWFFSQKTWLAPFSRRSTGYNAAMAKQHQHESPVLEVRRNKLSPPPLYTVLLLNDDFTPMDFVIHVLQRFFSMDREQATRIMLKVHLEGRGVCGVYPRDVAATKVGQVSSFARENQHPLACIMEEN